MFTHETAWQYSQDNTSRKSQFLTCANAVATVRRNKVLISYTFAWHELRTGIGLAGKIFIAMQAMIMSLSDGHPRKN
jgi:hypothetical protein